MMSMFWRLMSERVRRALRQSRSPCQRAGGSICRTTYPVAPLPQPAFFADVPLACLRGLVEDGSKASGWELLRRLTHRAVNGTVSHVMGGPSCKTFIVLRHRQGGPSPVHGPMDLYGLPELSACMVDRDTALFVRQVWLHAVATAGCKATPLPGVTRLEAISLRRMPCLVKCLVPEILDFGIPMPTKLDCLKSISTGGISGV